MEAIQSLESEIRELAKKSDLESVLREELNLEIQTLQRSQRAFSEATSSSVPVTYVSPSTENPHQSTVKYSIEGPIVSEKEPNISQAKNENAVPMESTNSEINRILARIEQDNRILAELEKSRSTVDLPPSAPEKISSKQFVTRQELDLLMAKLEQDNRILAELDKKREFSTKSLNGIAPSPSTLYGLPSSASSASLHSLLPTSLFQRFGDVMEDEMLDSIDFIELPGRGRCNIYCARYTYDPLKQSPNENPEAELALNAGDYVIIYGQMDEDGFFNGELLDGRKGLVPSNFVEKLTGEELFEFHATVLYGDSDESSVSFSYAQDMEMTVSDDLLHPEDFHRMNDYVDLEDFEDQDNEHFALGVPPPQRLILERQMNKSLLIGWVPPDVDSNQIEGYHVYVDGVPKATLQFSERTRALIEGVDSSRPHRVSVRSISSSGFHSKDAACTIVVGKDFPLAPTCVNASHITASSALISWLPSNSNFQHVIAVNSVEVKIVKPGSFRHHVTGLSPNTVYRVSVRVKPGKLLYNDEKNPKKLEMLVSNVEFKTLPKGLPDPPVNVSVEQGPQDGSILVTWLPVMTNPASPFVSQVIGYAVFAAGKKIAEIESPTGDHALIDGQQLLSLNKKTLTVKSKSVDGFSSDSLICVVPNELLRSVQKSVILKGRLFDERRRSSSSDSESDTELTELLNHVNRRARAFDPTLDSPFKGEDIHHEGLSDIVEEEEDTPTETKPKMLCKVESIKEVEPEFQVSRRKKRQGWKEHNSTGEPRRDISRVPSIADKEASQKEKITRDVMDEAGYSDEDSSKRSAVTSSQQRPLRTDSRWHRGPPSHRRQSHDSGRQPDRRTASRSDKQRDPISRYDDQSDSYSSNVDQGDNRVRFFVALFDYDPQTVSPNPDTADEELPFQEGQMIKIYGDKDADGFYRGESNGRTGLVPGNMVSQVQIDGEPFNHNVSLIEREVEERRIKKMVAIYDYDPQEISPNVDAEMELSFSVGDVIYVIGDVDEDGFYIGELNGLKGLVPSNFLRPLQESKGRYLEWNVK